jgi:thioredoxin-dependent peroxiredoxin
MLEPGHKAPDFTLADDHGRTFRLSDHKGGPVVVQFYCEDGTDGCLIENKEFSDLLPEFEHLGAAVVAISPQDVASHRKFSAGNGFRQPLLADIDLKANKAYGVWQLKKLWGREYMGTVRTTFVVDAQGRVAEVIRAQRIKGHAQKVLDAVKGLASPSR